MSGDNKPAEGGPAAAKPGGGTSKVVLALLVLNLGGTGFVAFKALQPTVVHAAKPHSAEDAAAAKNKPGPVVSLDPFVVNLNEEGSSRFLKASFELEVVDAATVKALEVSKRAVRDEVLRYLSGLTVADTLGESNKQKIQAGLVARIDKQLGGKGAVKQMYFSEFMVQ